MEMQETTQTTASVNDTIFALFADRPQAEAAINALTEQGYNAKDISIVMKDNEEARQLADNTHTNNVADGATSGAITGGAVGALAGLLIGVGAIAIPGLGGLLIGGPIAAALGLTGAAATTASGAITGALAGGLIGGLVSLGVPEQEAQRYEQRVKEGAILLAVPVNDRLSFSEARSILEKSGADSINEVHA
jgi:hypothetical protein